MNVCCIVCQVNMNLMESTASVTQNTAKSMYRCPTCNNTVQIIDSIENDKQRIRELEMLLIEAGEMIDDQEYHGDAAPQ